MPDAGLVLGVLIVLIFCILIIKKLVGGRRPQKEAELPGAPVKNSGLIAAITAAVNNYRNENSF